MPIIFCTFLHSRVLVKKGVQSFRKFSTSTMAKSKWEYVKNFETEEVLLPNCWAVARIDGRGEKQFSFSLLHSLEK